MAVQIQTRRDAAATWTSVNPTLAAGEIGIETDTGQLKFGNGTDAWTTLAYNVVASGVSVTVPVANGGTGLTAVGAAGKVLTSLAGANAYRDPAGDLVTATDAATVTFDLATSRRQIVTLTGNRTLALTGDADGMAFTVIVRQDATGGRVPTFWAGILWAGGVAPTGTTTANKYDVYAFLRISSGVYLGFTPSLNH